MIESAEVLVGALNDPQAEVRYRALLLVSESSSSDPALRSAVLSAFTDPVWCVREAAASAAGHLTDPDGTILANLVRMTLSDASPFVRLAAAATAGSRIEPERHYGGAIRHRFERQRIRAAMALGHVCAVRAGQAVQLLALSAKDNHPKVRLAALRAMRRMEPGTLLPLTALIVRKCGETGETIAQAARIAWEHVLTAPSAEPLRPLKPYPGTNNIIGVQIAIEGLVPDHPLRRVWVSLPLPPEDRTDAAQLARYLAAVCDRVLTPKRTQVVN